MKPFIKRLAILSLIGLGLGIIIGFFEINQAPTRHDRSYADPSVKGVAIGGPFALADHHGNRVTDKSWPGQYLLLFFGFTHCPDVCPLNLSIITEALENVSDEIVAKVQPLMITIDPDRDTPNAMKDYMSLFYPKFIGLTGTQAEIKVATKAYRVYEQKVLLEAAGGNPEDNYTMNHSSFTYLMGPDGTLVDVFAHNTPPQEIVTALRNVVSPNE